MRITKICLEKKYIFGNKRTIMMKTYIPVIKACYKVSEQCGFSNGISQWIEGRGDPSSCGDLL